MTLSFPTIGNEMGGDRHAKMTLQQQRRDERERGSTKKKKEVAICGQRVVAVRSTLGEGGNSEEKWTVFR